MRDASFHVAAMAIGYRHDYRRGRSWVRFPDTVANGSPSLRRFLVAKVISSGDGPRNSSHVSA